jgi:hypothetical protein
MVPGLSITSISFDVATCSFQPEHRRPIAGAIGQSTQSEAWTRAPAIPRSQPAAAQRRSSWVQAGDDAEHQPDTGRQREGEKEPTPSSAVAKTIPLSTSSGCTRTSACVPAERVTSRQRRVDLLGDTSGRQAHSAAGGGVHRPHRHSPSSRKGGPTRQSLPASTSPEERSRSTSTLSSPSRTVR